MNFSTPPVGFGMEPTIAFHPISLIKHLFQHTVPPCGQAVTFRRLVCLLHVTYGIPNAAGFGRV